MGPRGRAVAGGLLALAVAATAVLTLSPTTFFDALDPTLARALDTLHGWGLPAVVNLHAVELAANVVMFVPLGLCGALLVPRRRWWAVVVAGVVVSIGIELVQAAALPHRYASPRDVLGNTAGTVLGVALAAVLRPGRRT